mmetsp:Transcript_16449/g.53727  ORF Transcript_16449/g.53727 Transcript_16449/m.53727 type:complete len:209 (+) Transcript_16449:652-1278(+)
MDARATAGQALVRRARERGSRRLLHCGGSASAFRSGEAAPADGAVPHAAARAHLRHSPLRLARPLLGLLAAPAPRRPVQRDRVWRVRATQAPLSPRVRPCALHHRERAHRCGCGSSNRHPHNAARRHQDAHDGPRSRREVRDNYECNENHLARGGDERLDTRHRPAHRLDQHRGFHLFQCVRGHGGAPLHRCPGLHRPPCAFAGTVRI